MAPTSPRTSGSPSATSGRTPTRTFHVGHLGNAFLGEALASALAASGAEVRRNNLVGDIGRRVCEAMAGYRNRHEGEDPEEPGVPGTGSSRLLPGLPRQRRNEGRGGSRRPELRGEKARRGHRRLAEGGGCRGPARAELPGQMRGWSCDGHERILGRLGMGFDDDGFESDAVPRAMELIAEGVVKGIFVRRSTAASCTGPVRRSTPNGVASGRRFPTEHARLLASTTIGWLAEGQVYVEVAGIEWKPITVISEVLEKLVAGPRNETDVRVFHGSVTGMAGDKIGSSTGDVVWIDDFLKLHRRWPRRHSAGAARRRPRQPRGTRRPAGPRRLPLRADDPAADVRAGGPVRGRPGAGWTIAEARARPSWPRIRRRGRRWRGRS